MNSERLNANLLSGILKEQLQNFKQKDLGVNRSILSSLSSLIGVPQIVIITGLRRVGKSTLLAQIAKKYLNDDYYFINFEDERLLNFKAKDFDLLHETLITLFGEKKIFFLDEIQNVPDWERFVRRLHDQGYKFFITGSNASLLSQELGTRLTGRSIQIELFPFSFNEFLSFKQVEVPDMQVLTTTERGLMKRICNEYVTSGGIPDSLKYPEIDVHQGLYNDVIYRDIATRYNIDNTKSLKELALYLLSNTSSLISYNKLKELLKLGSVNTIKNYIEYLENSWLFFTLNKYAYSIKEQQIAAKKIYGIDTGLINSVGFSFSENKGKLIENIVFLHLRKRYNEIFYYKTESNHEVDFFIPQSRQLIQVSQNINSKDTFEREIRSLNEAYAEQKKDASLLLISQDDQQESESNTGHVEIIPLYRWLLS